MRRQVHFSTQQAMRLSSRWHILRKTLTAGKKSEAELCAQIVLDVCQSLRPTSWRNGKSLNSLSEFDPSSALRTISNFRLRGIPSSVHWALVNWAHGHIQLKTFYRLPTPYEVLCLQAQGIRCVSLMIDANEIVTFEHEGRNFFELIIHDLVHVEHMTRNSDAFLHQTQFAKWVLKHWDLFSRGSSLEAQGELEYLASDMNSHLIHLMKTLKSWMQRHRPVLLNQQHLFGDPELQRRWDHLNTEGEHVHHQHFVTAWDRCRH